MSGYIRYQDDVKKDAVSQVVERGYSVRDVAERLGISTKSLYTWKAEFSKPDTVRNDEAAIASELRQLKRELTRVTEERDILKKGDGVLRQRIPVRDAFSDGHRGEFAVRPMCRMLRVHFSGFYAWLKNPLSNRAKEDERQTALVKQRPGRTVARSTAIASCMTIYVIRASNVPQTALPGWPVLRASKPRSATNVGLGAMAADLLLLPAILLLGTLILPFRIRSG